MRKITQISISSPRIEKDEALIQLQSLSPFPSLSLSNPSTQGPTLYLDTLVHHLTSQLDKVAASSDLIARCISNTCQEAVSIQSKMSKNRIQIKELNLMLASCKRVAVMIKDIEKDLVKYGYRR